MGDVGAEQRPRAAEPPRPRVDERVLGAGTGARFAMLLLLMPAACGSLMLAVLTPLADGDRAACELAAGVDPADPDPWTAPAMIVGQQHAFDFCVSRWAPSPPWWQVAVWPVLVLVGAAVLFHVLPLWKARRSRVVPLEAIDPGGRLRTGIDLLVTEAGLRRKPRIVVDPAAVTGGAVVFGSDRRPVLCLHGGLLAVRRADPARFRTVVLHELAHIANRDVTLTYATVSVWRAFLLLVLVPALLWEGFQVYQDVSAGGGPSLDRDVLLALLTAVPVHLARWEILRSREFWADLTALRWAADPRGWPTAVAGPAGAGRGPLRRLSGLWRTHPHVSLRQEALADPEALFRVPALMVFLTGATACTVQIHLLNNVAPYGTATTGRYLAAALPPALLIAAGVGIALWRAVAYAVLTGAPVASGAVPGAWLGAGMSAATLVSGPGPGTQWIPERPWLLLVPVAVGAVVGAWSTRCADLWARTWRGRTLRPALLTGQTGLAVVVASWLVWWQLYGVAYLTGFSLPAEGVARWVTARYPTTAPPEDVLALPGLMLTPVLDGFAAVPLVALGAALMGVVPLAAWAVGPPGGRPRWMPAGGPVPPADVPPLRRVMLPALVCGALACLALLLSRAYLHDGQPPPDARGGSYALRHVFWTLTALAVPSLLAAVAVATAAGRFRLPAALVAAQITTLLGYAGVTVLVSVDGCLGFLNVLADRCGVQPPWRVARFPHLLLLNVASVLGVLAAVVGTALVAALSPLQTSPKPTLRPGAEPVTRVALRRRGAAALCAVAVGVSTAVGGVHLRVLSAAPESQVAAARATQLLGVPGRTVPAATRVNQVDAWYRLGGDGGLHLVISYGGRLATALGEAKDTDSWDSLERRFRPLCRDWARVGVFEVVWFRVPDPDIGADWHAMAARAEDGSRRCAQALDARDRTAFLAALRQLVGAGNCAAKANARIDALLRGDGRPGTAHRPGGNPVCVRVAR
ncbi:M48 family metalloprotease [Streptomyces sp. NPDC056049]|uniref:M48 family metalloprotease n=1 Tax=Streptomyces sp. NPDC056049 TaxID=3345693 RepID=UPI0035DF2D5B